MNNKLAKLTPPYFEAVYPRNRLFRQLDKWQKAQAIWIVAPAGSGKTTLIGSYLKSRQRAVRWYQVDDGDADAANFSYYLGLLTNHPHGNSDALPVLTPEYRLGGVSGFFRKFFRSFYQHLPHQGTWVLDNCQEAGSDLFHELIAIAIQEVPPDFQIILISREQPPAELARLRATNQLRVMDQEALRLTMEETKGICKLHLEHSAAEHINSIHTITQGWAAGVVLLLAQENQGLGADRAMPHKTQQTLFNYFAAEVLQGTSPALRDLLLKTAFIPHITVQMAVMLTGNGQAGGLLQDLASRNYFTYLHEGETVYFEYHPLFAAFLRAQLAAHFDAATIKDLRRRSAVLLLEADRHEQAFELFIESDDWQSATGIILSQANEFIKHGRDQIIRQWVRRLPATVVAEHAWLQFWLGAGTVAVNPAEGLLHFEQAFYNFKQHNDVAGCYLAWAGVIECLWIPMAPTPMRVWIGEFENLQDKFPEFPSVEIEVRVVGLLLLAIFWSSPDHPRFSYWVERALNLWQAQVDDTLRLDLINRLYLCFSITGNLVKAREIKTLSAGLLRKVKSPLATLFGYMAGMYNCGVSGNYTHGLEIFYAAEKLQADTGINVYAPLILSFGARLTLLGADLIRAEAVLKTLGQALAPGPENVDKAHYCFLMSWYALEKGDIQLADEYADRAVTLSSRFTAYYPVCESLFVKITVLLAREQYGQAEEVLRQLENKANQVKFDWVIYICLVVRTHIERLKNPASTPDSLRRMLEIAHRNDYAIPFACPTKLMATLYELALMNNIETNFVKRKIRETRIQPELLCAAAWPWPVRISTLGRFELEVNGETVDLSGNKHRRPCDLLKLLIAAEPRGITEVHLAGILWPELDGDTAMRNLRTNLHRLRRLLGNDAAVQVRQGQAGLNLQLCRLDITALYHLLNTVPGAAIEDLPALADELLDSYHGPFLPSDDEPHILAYRKRLQQHLMNGLSQLAARLRATRQHDAADTVCDYLAGRVEQD